MNTLSGLKGKGVGCSCFTAPEMLACTLAHIVSPGGEERGGPKGGERRGDGGRGRRREELADKWLTFHWQTGLFPIWLTFSRAEV